MKWVKMYHITISVVQYYIEKPVCLLFLNRPFEAYCFFNFVSICGRKD